MSAVASFPKPVFFPALPSSHLHLLLCLGNEGSCLRREAQTFLFLATSTNYFKRGWQSFSKPTQRYNLPRVSWVCPGVFFFIGMREALNHFSWLLLTQRRPALLQSLPKLLIVGNNSSSTQSRLFTLFQPRTIPSEQEVLFLVPTTLHLATKPDSLRYLTAHKYCPWKLWPEPGTVSELVSVNQAMVPTIQRLIGL